MEESWIRQDCLPSFGPGGDQGSGCGAPPCDGNAWVWARPAAKKSRGVVFIMEVVVVIAELIRF